MELSDRIENSPYAESWNVAGEIYGAMAALRYCEEHGFSPVVLHYDYEGVGEWALGTWKANTQVAKDYVEFLSTLTIKMGFKKVKGHSGDPLNERCDELAKNATVKREPAETTPDNVADNTHHESEANDSETL